MNPSWYAMEVNTIGIERTGCLLLSSSAAGGLSDSQDLIRLLLVMDIGEHFEQFIKSQIQQYRYLSASEVIREGLWALEVHEQHRAAKLEALRPDIQQGINSGPGRPVQDAPAVFCDLSPLSRIHPCEIQYPSPPSPRARPPVNSTSGSASRNNNPTTRNTSLKASREAWRPTWSLSSCRA